MQSNIRVNITNNLGNRTSTTVNFTIAEFYYRHVTGRSGGEGAYKQITNVVSELVRNNNLTSKSDIEEKLLTDIYNHQVAQIVADRKNHTNQKQKS